MTNYLKLFSSVSEQDAFRDGEDYVEPHVSCIEDGTSVKYNKREVDIVLDCQGMNSCVGQKITSMSSKIGSYVEHDLGDGVYWYEVSNANVTTAPVESLKVQVTNSVDVENTIYDTPLENSNSTSCHWSFSADGGDIWVNSYYDNNQAIWEFSATVSTGC